MTDEITKPPLSVLTKLVRKARLDLANNPGQEFNAAERIRRATRQEIERYREFGYSEKELVEATI